MRSHVSARRRLWGTSALLATVVLGALLAWGGRSGPARAQEGPPQPVDGCSTCHDSDEILQTDRPSLRVGPQDIDGSVHGGLSCEDCHGTLPAAVHEDAAQQRRHALDSCATCHQAEDRMFRQGAHGDPSLGNHVIDAPDTPPRCVTCHGAHDVQPPSREFIRQVAQTCSDCHGERGESFFDRDFHGKQFRLGRSDVAGCPDCHTGHRVLPASNPASSVNQHNVVGTCRGCHEGAPANFAGVVIHIGGSPLPVDPRLRMVTLWMSAILAGTFLFFGAHTVLGIRHAWNNRAEHGGHPADEEEP